VAAQAGDETSMLELYRAALRLRREHPGDTATQNNRVVAPALHDPLHDSSFARHSSEGTSREPLLTWKARSCSLPTPAMPTARFVPMVKAMRGFRPLAGAVTRGVRLT
jgi:hypothetical protein